MTAEKDPLDLIDFAENVLGVKVFGIMRYALENPGETIGLNWGRKR